MLSRLVLILGLLILCVGCSTISTGNCIEDRLAYDFGSGSVKAKAAQVDHCERKIVRVYFDTQEKISFKDDLQTSADKALSRTNIDKALTFIANTKEKTSGLKLKSIRAVATSAFRDASNSQKVLSEIQAKEGLKIQLISQDQEGKLGFWSAVAKNSEKPELIAVWDIGGGSQQISFLEDGKIKVIKSQVASVSFRDEIIRQVKKGNPQKVKTPNPMSSGQINQARSLVASLVEKNIVPELPKTRKFFGVGGVLSISVRNQVGDEAVTVGAIDKVLSSKANKTDKVLGGEYASTDVSNLILVSSLMSLYGFDQYQAVKANLTDGLLVGAEDDF